MKEGGDKVKYRLKDLQINGRYYGGDVIFDNKKEIKDVLITALKSEDDYEEEENYNDLPLWEVLEMAGYKIEEIREREYES